MRKCIVTSVGEEREVMVGNWLVFIGFLFLLNPPEPHKYMNKIAWKNREKQPRLGCLVPPSRLSSVDAMQSRNIGTAGITSGLV
jgi:hypothetical protein